MNTGHERLAIEGGPPVRTRPFPPAFWGATVVGDEELALVTEVIKSRCLFRDYGDGQPHMVKDLEREARAYLGVPYALGVTSGSAALYCAMAGLGLGPGDEVIMPSLIWLSDFMAPLAVGATPVFADINRTLNMDPDDLERKITPRTKAVIVVHFLGGTNDMDRLITIARQRGVKVIEDCAQAFGATYKGRKVGSMGDVGCFSFQHNKIVTTGDGGLLCAQDPLVFERAVRYHDLGILRAAIQEQLGGAAHVPQFAGLQFRMNELTGAVALAQLRKVDSAVLGVTRRHFHRLKNALTAECPGVKFRESGDDPGDAGIALYLDLETPERAAWFTKAIEAEGLRPGATTRVCDTIPTDLVQNRRQAHPALPPFGPGCPGEAVRYSLDSCPNTDRIISSMVAIMLTPNLSDEDVQDIQTALVKVWRANS
jgi:8-amino-3,8-dideoxy-alpha-D-manno-octulosonate transaminase